MNTIAETVVKALRNLTAPEIEARLQELDAEADGLRTLLRSVKARDRTRRLHESARPAADSNPAKRSKGGPPPAA